MPKAEVMHLGSGAPYRHRRGRPGAASTSGRIIQVWHCWQLDGEMLHLHLREYTLQGCCSKRHTSQTLGAQAPADRATDSIQMKEIRTHFIFKPASMVLSILEKRRKRRTIKQTEALLITVISFHECPVFLRQAEIIYYFSYL